MSLKAFVAVLLAAFATGVVLSIAWEFWLEDILLAKAVLYHERETTEERWEFVATSAVFSLLALIAPAVIGTQIIRRDRVLRETVTRLAQEDYLTGLNNRRRVTELLENEFRRASRYDTAFSVILADVDDFKAINDQLGHEVGDRVLVQIAEVIRSSVRVTDIVGRWGGEEFIIVSPGTDINGGLSLAEKVRTRLESADIGGIGRRTASFGVTAFSEGDDLKNITARADVGLYAAKQGGRNRVETVPASVSN